jgi:hypothetical protein
MFMASLFRGILAHGRFHVLAAAVAALTVSVVARPSFGQPFPEDGIGPSDSVLVPAEVDAPGSPQWDGHDQAFTGNTFVGDADGGDGVMVSDLAGGDRCDACACGSPDCRGCGHGWFNNDCEPPGLVQRIMKASDACWIGRVDALVLWRNAPPDRPILNDGPVVGTVLNANGMDSTAAAGPRFSLFRVNNCTGNALEITYLRAANFRSVRPLSLEPVPYTLAPPGIYGNDSLSFDSGNANLGSRLQSFELNHHHCHGEFIRFLAGFRWIDWQEQFTLQGNTSTGISDFYQTDCFNDLYGGQIGLDANLLALSWIRFDSVIKAGVYFNNGVQSSQYITNDPANPGRAAVAINESPVSGAFAGELGFTGVVPVTRNLDIRVGYFGLWLSGIVQPTQQLSEQQLTPGQPEIGTINADGSVVVQGVSLGLEGRW